VFLWLGRAVAKFRWLIVSIAAAVVVAGVLWGAGVFNVLSSGGFADPNSESSRAATQITAQLGQQDVDLVVLYSSQTATVDDASFKNPVVATEAALRNRPEVAKVLTFYDTNTPTFVSRDRHETYAAITLAAQGDDAKKKAYTAIERELPAPGLTSQVGGLVAFNAAGDDLTKKDVTHGEMLAMPLVLILLIFVFRGLIAAATPLVIGIVAILGGLTATRVIAEFTSVSTFAANTITLLGLGMAIDYSLFIVNRFREEMLAGNEPRQAIARTITTAGRTVVVSGMTIALALASLLIFPQVFLRSMGMGGIAAVLVAMIAAVTVLPALLVMLGPRINALRIPLPHRRRPAPAGPGDEESGGWARFAHTVMRRPAVFIVGVLIILGVLASPFLSAKFAGADERILPAGTESRVVSERIAADFPGGLAAPIETLVDGASAAQVQEIVGQIKSIPGITGAQIVTSKGDSALIDVGYAGGRTDQQTYDAVRAIRALPLPPGATTLVGGQSASDVDLLASLGAHLPWMAAIMAGVTLLVLFLAFGSFVLPIKAVVMNVLSIAASFGVVVFIFQEGHFSHALGFTATGFLQPNIPIMVLAILFGLSTDYEVFLLSRIREAWDATHDPTRAVAIGLERTGRIITAAALLLVVVVAGFATGGVAFAKLIGIGMVTAIVVDATLVRALLVPAVMRLLGRSSWWAPGPFARLYRQYGIHETASADARPARVAPVPSTVAPTE
jgi:RND superfamily putative drug exporter